MAREEDWRKLENLEVRLREFESKILSITTAMVQAADRFVAIEGALESVELLIWGEKEKKDPDSLLKTVNKTELRIDRAEAELKSLDDILNRDTMDTPCVVTRLENLEDGDRRNDKWWDRFKVWAGWIVALILGILSSLGQIQKFFEKKPAHAPTPFVQKPTTPIKIRHRRGPVKPAVPDPEDDSPDEEMPTVR